MAVLPHYSPGYPEWDIAEQPRLLELIRRARAARCPAAVEVLESGMLRPKKSLLAVFGLTRHIDRVRRLTRSRALRELLVSPLPVPPRAVSPRRRLRSGRELSAVRAMRRRSGRRSRSSAARPRLPSTPSTPRRCSRWADERLSLTGTPTARSTRCSATTARPARNMGRPLQLRLPRQARPARARAIRSASSSCAPAPGDDRPHATCAAT